MLITDTGVMIADSSSDNTIIKSMNEHYENLKEINSKAGIKDEESNSVTHYLKSYTDRFQLLWENKVRAEIRPLDPKRNYKVGDNCYLIEGHSDQGVWIGTGNVLSFKIKHVDTFGLGKDSVLLHYELITKVFIKDIEKSIKELKQFGF